MYQLLITPRQVRHRKKRSVLESKVLFRGVHSRLKVDLSGNDKSKAARSVPTLYSMAGEQETLSKRFKEAIRAVTKAVNCIGWSHCHFVRAPKEEEGHAPTNTPLFEVGETKWSASDAA